MAVQLIDVALLPGEYFVGGAQHRIRTLLGSCVAMTLWHPQLRIGAMSHFLLPRRDPSRPGAPDGRYGEEVLALMLAQLRRRGVDARQCQAKVFGGGAMFPQIEPHGGAGIGHQNAQAALHMLERHDIDVVSQSVLGVGHRQIVFYVRSGDIWVRRQLPRHGEHA